MNLLNTLFGSDGVSVDHSLEEGTLSRELMPLIWQFLVGLLIVLILARVVGTVVTKKL